MSILTMKIDKKRCLCVSNRLRDIKIKLLHGYIIKQAYDECYIKQQKQTNHGLLHGYFNTT